MHECHNTDSKRHNNDKTQTHNHNEYPLLYKGADLLAVSFGQIFRVPEVGTARPRASCIYIRQSTRGCVITYTYTYIHTYKQPSGACTAQLFASR